VGGEDGRHSPSGFHCRAVWHRRLTPNPRQTPHLASWPARSNLRNETVDRDKGQEIRYCSPTGKTKAFAIIDHDGYRFKLDVGGNRRAAELVQKTGKKPLYIVAVTGEMKKKTIKVDSISVIR
jgi:hypothetical protein